MLLKHVCMGIKNSWLRADHSMPRPHFRGKVKTHNNGSQAAQYWRDLLCSLKQAAFELSLKHSYGHHFDPYLDFSLLWTCSRCSPFFSGFPPSQALGEDRGGGRHVCLNSFSLDNLKKCCSYKEGCQTKSKWTILSKYVTDWNAVAVIQRNWLSRFQFLLNLDIPTTL